ncbi:hypothetical protein V8E53_006297, partial [Lactarius tabidus]
IPRVMLPVLLVSIHTTKAVDTSESSLWSHLPSWRHAEHDAPVLEALKGWVRTQHRQQLLPIATNSTVTHTAVFA